MRAIVLMVAALSATASAQFWREAETKALAEPFKGITADGSLVPGLFAVQSTGVSTAPVKAAAEVWLAALSPEQRKSASFAMNDDEWRKWMNINGYVRQGVSFRDMDDRQRTLAFTLMRAGLSATGFKLSRDIMHLNARLGDLALRPEEYGDDLYWLTVMGTPSLTEPWGWQLDGHHLIVNYVVIGDQVVMTPTFVGSEPIRATAGPYAGTEILQSEQDKGLALIKALDDSQRAKAIFRTAKDKNDNQTEAFKDNAVVPQLGLNAMAMTPEQRTQFMDLIAAFVGIGNDGHAAVKMREVMAHLDKTTFAWAGGIEPDSVFYYRIQSPVILIEFDHQLPANIPVPAEKRAPTRDHIHVVIRTPNGNDYGNDLLRQHYETTKTDPNHRH